MGGQVSMSMRPPPPNTVVGERYTLARYLGAGAIGAVYEATTSDAERVALKLLLVMHNSPQGEEVAARFVREAEVASKLKSEHIAQVIDWGHDDVLQTSYLVMPLLCGFDLEVALGRTGAMHPAVAARMAVQACHGLAAAHAQDVVHRDVKPENLFLDHQPNGTVTVRVLDFGLAKVIGSEMNLTGEDSILGTPHYMAPEQIVNAKEVDARADVWSLGATLYHALTGRSPFTEQRGFTDLCLAITGRDVPPVQDRAPWVDPALAAIVEGALLRDRATRCPDAASLGRALEPFMAGGQGLRADMIVPLDEASRAQAARRASPTKRWQPQVPKATPPAPPPAASDHWLGRNVAGHALLRALGSPNGSLYEARGADGERHAVRVLPPQTDGTQNAQRVEQRVDALRQLDDLHLERVLALQRDEGSGRRAVITEALSGVDLGSLIDKHGPLDPQVATAIGWQACQGLVALHTAGLVHGALRPGRLFVQEHADGELTVKLTGLASTAAPEGARAKRGWLFAAPEQARPNGAAGELGDVFSLGGCLFHGLTGAPPWPRALSASELRHAIIDGRPRHVQDLAPWVRRELAALVHRALEPDPAERWLSAAALLQALEPLAQLRHLRRRDVGPVPRGLRARVESRAEPIHGGEPIEVTAPAADATMGGAATPDSGQAPRAAADDSLAHSDPPDSAKRLATGRGARAPLLLLLLLLLVGALGYAAWQAFGEGRPNQAAPAAPKR